MLEQQPTASELLHALGRIYVADRRELTAQILLLVRTLSQAGLVTMEDAGGGERALDFSHSGSPRPFERFEVQSVRDLSHLFPARSTASGDAIARANFVCGASVGAGGGSVLLVGNSGSGKSATVETCVAAGMSAAGDGACDVT